MKKFLEWIGLKEQLDNTEHKPPHVSEGDIWWASVGENVGSEINGKSKLFSRPVIILKKLAMDHRRLSSKLGTLDDADLLRVKNGFHSLYK